MNKKLTPKQSLFVKEYLIDLNATRAAKAAGYSNKTANRMGSENLTKPVIRQAIQIHMDKRSERTEITADRVLEEIAKIGFGNIQNLYDKEGKLLHVNELDSNVAATIQEITEDTVGSDGEAVVIRRKYKVADKKSSLELLGRHLKLFTDKIEHDHKISHEESLDELE